ncbi:MAG: hypothetical protein ACYCXF_00030 [Thermoleophilia bacterium]
MSPSRPTRRSESRVSRLERRRESRNKFTMRVPRLDRRTEIGTVIAYAIILTLAAVALVTLIGAGVLDPASEPRIILSFAMGLIATYALASSLAFLITLRHRLLAIALIAALVAAGAIALGLTPLEGLGKIVFAATAGLWIALMLSSISQVLLISALVILVDFYSVFFGPTKKMVESGGHWIEYLTINLPVFGADAVSRLGVSDIIFFALFLGSTMTFRLRRLFSALAMTLSFVVTMIVGVTMDLGVPALPLLSIFFVLANADLLYARYLSEPDGGGENPREHRTGRRAR